MEVKTDTFEGPLDLLLHLIEKAEVDIYDVSLTEITNQYMAYIQKWQNLQLEVASEYLVMAATLLHVKSRSLLPQEEDVEGEEYEEEIDDPREMLILRLLEYKKYKQVAQELRGQEYKRSQVYTRPAADLSPYAEDDPNPVGDVSLFDLCAALQKALSEPKPERPVRQVSRDAVSIDQRLEEVTNIISSAESMPFQQLCNDARSREEIVVTFLVVLELMKRKWIRCQQNRTYEDIHISWVREVEEDGRYPVKIDH